ncbi:hypothetical protein DSM02_2659 [Leeuwenhoekiella polynyae]|uniref:Uncharacterized protein n=1 Tax=Leeuwenhoekiella polynyae TaxID=1550906 RepID=A0A4Q0P167_9FLAO|nr:hypothetical protein DSM02_2659 [Leeuwenhoekiella polynyae]
MKGFQHKLEDFSFEKLEERKEFTFYYSSHDSGCAKTHHSCNPCPPPPTCGGSTPG